MPPAYNRGGRIAYYRQNSDDAYDYASKEITQASNRSLREGLSSDFPTSQQHAQCVSDHYCHNTTAAMKIPSSLYLLARPL